MKEYTVNIEETINQEFTVTAETANQAIDIAIKKYKNCEFVLDDPSLTYKMIAVVDPDNERTEWMPF